MAKMTEDEYFDPRKHSAVTLRITEKVRGDFAGDMELPIKTYYVGPQKRPSTAPSSRGSGGGGRKVTMAPGPDYLNKDGTWSLGAPINNLQQRSLTQTMSTLPGGRDIAPVAAVHSYADSSPVVTADYTHELHTNYPARPQSSQGFLAERGRKQTEYQAEYLSSDLANGGGGGAEAWSGANDQPAASFRQRPQSAGPQRPHTPGDRGGGMDTSFKDTARRNHRSDAGATQMRNTSGRVQHPLRSGMQRSIDGVYRSTSSPRQRPQSASAGGAAYTTKGPKRTIVWDGQQHQSGDNLSASYDEDVYGVTSPTLNITSPARGASNAYSFNRTTARLGASHNVTGKLWSPATLSVKDLNREVSLGKSVSPCSPNAKLVGGRWRHIPRAASGDVVYTDYYGRYGAESNNYYGRGYTVDPRQHQANRVLPHNLEYDRVRASIPGIETLRNRPGLVLKSTIINGPTDSLPQPTVRMHKISDTYRLKPASDRATREPLAY